MSLLLSGAKTATIAGTEMQCVEIYMGESYTFPLSFKYSNGTAINITSWTLTASVKYYSCDIAYPIAQSTTEEINLKNIAAFTPQPTSPAIPVAIVDGNMGTAYVYIPDSITPILHQPTVTDTTSLLAIVVISISRPDSTSGTIVTNREPIGLIIRYL